MNEQEKAKVKHLIALQKAFFLVLDKLSVDGHLDHVLDSVDFSDLGITRSQVESWYAATLEKAQNIKMLKVTQDQLRDSALQKLSREEVEALKQSFLPSKEVGLSTPVTQT